MGLLSSLSRARSFLRRETSGVKKLSWWRGVLSRKSICCHQSLLAFSTDSTPPVVWVTLSSLSFLVCMYSLSVPSGSGWESFMDNFRINQSISHFLPPLVLLWSGAHPSSHGVKAGLHSGRVTSLWQGQIERQTTRNNKRRWVLYIYIFIYIFFFYFFTFATFTQITLYRPERLSLFQEFTH